MGRCRRPSRPRGEVASPPPATCDRTGGGDARGGRIQLLLTDRLACPRCGPEFGLVLLSDRMEDRRVVDGKLGCPNCRDAFPIENGFGDLRAPPRRRLSRGLAGEPADPDAEAVVRVAALLGITGGPGTIALVGAPAALGVGLGARLDGVHVVGIDADLHAWPNEPTWSRIVARPGLPFFSRTLRGVAVDGRLGPTWAADAARACAPKCRVVVTDAPADARGWLEDAGMAVLAAESGTVVAEGG